MIELNALSLLWTKRLAGVPAKDGVKADRGIEGDQPNNHVRPLDAGPEPPGPDCCWFIDGCCWVKC